MVTYDLQPEQFHAYPLQARKLAVQHIATLKRLPLSFLPSLLREVIAYDWKFPAERKQLEKELANLSSLSTEQVSDWFHGFARIRISSKLEHLDWINQPAQFVEQLAAHLWTTNQLDAFRAAAIAYADRLRAAVPADLPPVPRLGISVIGQGVKENNYSLFRNLRSHGVYFSRVRPENGLKVLMDTVAARAKKYPAPHGHWYIDGGRAIDHDPALTCVSYQDLAPERTALLRRMETKIQSAGMGPEKLRTILAQIRPEDLRPGAANDPVLSRFQVSLLTEGSGTQIFSTTFVQWAAREGLRRAQPLSLLARFAPRQRQRPMNEMLSGTHAGAEVDLVGSLIDSDMGAYYNWLNQHRLPGAEQSSFLVWFEDHNEAVAVAPSMPRGTHSRASVGIGELLAYIS